ncbi:hypothetical protein HYT51_01250 [Candidatus Woesearchaeota archaeon]|nr:hypothetical protein [Candidatus Woesearchaeota archaeon]
MAKNIAFLEGKLVRMDTLDSHVIEFEFQIDGKSSRYRVNCGRGISQLDLSFSDRVMVSGKESDGIIIPSRVWNKTRNICYHEEQLFPKRAVSATQY